MIGFNCGRWATLVKNIKHFLKEIAVFIENFKVILTLFLGTIFIIGLTYKSTTYWHNSYIKNLEQKHDLEIKNLAQNHSDDNKKLENRLEEMNTRYTSVRRVIGDDGEFLEHFDLSDVFFNKREFPRYKTRYTWYGDNDFGVRLAEHFDWKFNKINILILAELFKGDSSFIWNDNPLYSPTRNFAEWLNIIKSQMRDEFTNKTIDFLASQDVFLWHSENLHDVKLNCGRNFFCPRKIFNSHIAVAVIKNDFFQDLFKFLSPELRIFFEGMLQGFKDSAYDVSEANTQDDTIEAMEHMLLGLYDEENINLMNLIVLDHLRLLIVDFVAMQSKGIDNEVYIRSYQRKRNLFYVSYQHIFRGAYKGENGLGENIYVDSELFVIGRRHDMIMIMVNLPSIGDTNDGYSLVQTWFSDIKIPVDIGE